MAQHRKPSPLERVRAFDLELNHTPKEYCAMHFWMQCGGKRVVVGYLAHDEHCHNPLDGCDGSGKIVTQHDDKQFRAHIDHSPDSEPVLDQFIEILARLKGIKVDEFHEDEDINAARLMFDEALNQGKVGTAYAVALVEQHQSGYREWNKGTIDAVWIPDKSLLEHIDSFPIEKRREEARKCFENALEEYNSWAEGDCYGVVIDVFVKRECGEYHHDDEESNSCWGYVGHIWAKSTLKDEFECNVKHYRKKASRKKISQTVKKSIANHV